MEARPVPGLLLLQYLRYLFIPTQKEWSIIWQSESQNGAESCSEEETKALVNPLLSTSQMALITHFKFASLTKNSFISVTNSGFLRFQSSNWRKVRNVVQWTPFIQTYKRQKYPWVQLAGHQGMWSGLVSLVPIWVLNNPDGPE